MKLKITFISLICFFTINSFGFDIENKWVKNKRKKYPVGINLGVLGPTGWGNLSLDWFINSNIDIEAGLGILSKEEATVSYFGGVKYHVLGKSFSNFTPYFGVMDAVYFLEGGLKQHNLYFPIGIHKIKRDKFSWALEMAYQFTTNENNHVWGSFKIGYRLF